MKKTIVIGSRGSQLALWQANHVAGRLNELGITTRIEIIRTTGDRMQTADVVKGEGKGLFTKEIEESLLARTIDLAVHSLKDLPTEGTPGLTIAAVPEREDPRDALVGAQLNNLGPQARIGTSSNRRAAQLRILRPDLQFEPVRGNVDTRLRKLAERQFDALVLAAAGLRRLGFSDRIAQLFDENQICPAPGQGALALQTRTDDEALEICRSLNHPATEAAVACERAVLAALGGGCDVPIGAYASVQGTELRVVAGVFSPTGPEHVRTRQIGVVTQPVELGRKAAQELINLGAQDLLQNTLHA